MSSESSLIEISTALSDIAEGLDSSLDKEIASGLTEIAASLADLVQMIETKDKADYSSIVAAIGKLKLSTTVAAPSVNVNVSPTPITLNPSVVLNHGARLKSIRFNTNPVGRIESADMIWEPKAGS